MAPNERRGHCPVCESVTIDRSGGEWCPRCMGWVQWLPGIGNFGWQLTRPK
jgi:hypothetical protein